MAKLVLTNAYVSLDGGSTDHSDHVKGVTFEVSADVPDATAMSESWSNVLSGTKSATLSIEAYADFADDNISEDVWTAFDAGTAMTVWVAPNGSTPAATNPVFKADWYVQSFPPLSGSHGDVVMMPIQFALGDSDGIERDITP